MKPFLFIKKTNIVQKDTPLRLKGVNLGGWLMPEGYIMHAPNYGVYKFRDSFHRALGKRALEDLEETFRKNWVTEKDIQKIAHLGFNCIRVPFHYKLIEWAAYRYNPNGVRWLDRVIHWAKKSKMWVILDFHAAPGAQNHDWHGDSSGDALLWKKSDYQNRSFALWEYLADRYKDEPAVAGYDLLNEAVLKDDKKLNRFYAGVIKHIRRVDKNHILFIEGNNWATDIKCLDKFSDNNYAISIHSYEPLDFTFNYVPHIKYPFSNKRRKSNKALLRKHLLQYKKFSDQRLVPIFVGEFGVNFRDGRYGEEKWVEDNISLFNQFGFHWTYWTYKAIKNAHFPDGVYSYYENPSWVNRSGPLTGWDTYYLHWKNNQRKMSQSWRTDQFRPNPPLVKVLKDGL